MNIKGEYWVIGRQIDFADSNIGDQNHESIAFDHIFSKYVDEIEELAKEFGIKVSLTKFDELNREEFNLVMREIYEILQNKKLTIQQINSLIMKKLDINKDTFDVLFGGSDPRLYAIKYLNWIAVRSNNIELYGYDQSKQKIIANAIAEILYEENGNEEPNPAEVEISIHDYKTNKSWYMTLEELEQTNVSVKAPQIPNTTYNKPLNLQNKEIKTPPKENPWKNASKKVNLIGHGQDLWRGTSEHFSFKDFLKNL